MKIVHVETGRNLYGGAQQVLYLSRGLLERGIDSTILCPPDSAIAAAARQQDLPFQTIVCRGDFDLVFAFRLKAWIQQRRPDLVHCHSRRGADFLGGRAARMTGIPAVLSRRVDTVESRFTDGFRYSPFKKLVAISNNVAQSLRDSAVNSERIEIIRSAVDSAELGQPISKAQWLQEFELQDDHIVAVIAAQFIPRKGHRLVLEGLPALCRAHANFRLVLFGKGPLELSLRQQVAALGIGDQVLFAGFRDDLDQLLGCADVLIHPATAEGLGVIMLKAAAAGLPVVAFDIAGSKEAVISGQTGLLARPGDSASLLQAITHLIENPSERARLGAAGQVRMRESFSIDTMVAKHISLYETVIREANPNPN